MPMSVAIDGPSPHILRRGLDNVSNRSIVPCIKVSIDGFSHVFSSTCPRSLAFRFPTPSPYVSFPHSVHSTHPPRPRVVEMTCRPWSFQLYRPTRARKLPAPDTAITMAVSSARLSGIGVSLYLCSLAYRASLTAHQGQRSSLRECSPFAKHSRQPVSFRPSAPGGYGDE